MKYVIIGNIDKTEYGLSPLPRDPDDIFFQDVDGNQMLVLLEFEVESWDVAVLKYEEVMNG